ncbi:hypothetical protein B0H11DRAFT_1922483 [Mycena galericulata]|nr:hypothetical protein B0H11DRAFT_1922483 [Mycena galericulata]
MSFNYYPYCAVPMWSGSRFRWKGPGLSGENVISVWQEAIREEIARPHGYKSWQRENHEYHATLKNQAIGITLEDTTRWKPKRNPTDSVSPFYWIILRQASTQLLPHETVSWPPHADRERTVAPSGKINIGANGREHRHFARRAVGRDPAGIPGGGDRGVVGSGIRPARVRKSKDWVSKRVRATAIPSELFGREEMDAQEMKA